MDNIRFFYTHFDKRVSIKNWSQYKEDIEKRKNAVVITIENKLLLKNLGLSLIISFAFLGVKKKYPFRIKITNATENRNAFGTSVQKKKAAPILINAINKKDSAALKASVVVSKGLLSSADFLYKR